MILLTLALSTVGHQRATNESSHVSTGSEWGQIHPTAPKVMFVHTSGPQGSVHGPVHSLRSLQHDVLKVLLQNGVFDCVEDEADIFCVHCSSEVVEEWLPSVPPLPAKGLHQERLHIF